MLKKKVWLTTIASLLILAMLLAACQAGQATQEAEPTATEAAAEEPTPAEEMAEEEPAPTEEMAEEEMAEAGGTLEIFSWWTAGGEAEALNALYDQYREEYPNVEIINAAVAGGAGSNAKAVLATRMQSDNPPDSFQVHAGHELIDSWVVADRMEPVTFIFEENGWRDVYPPDLLEIISYEGEIWSVPVDIHRSNVLWTNKAVFEENGLSEPTTFEEFFEVADQLQEAGVTPLALGDNNTWPATHLLESVLLGTLGPDAYRGLWTGETDWGSEEVTQALETFVQMLDYVNEDHASLTWDQASQLVADGDAAMNVMGDWASGYFQSVDMEPGTDYGFVASPNTDGSYLLLSDSFGLPEGAPHRENAIAWLELIGSAEAQDAFNPIKGSIPPRTDAGDSPEYDAYLQSAMEDFQQDALVPSLAHGAAASEGWVTSVNDVMSLFVTDRDVEAAQEGLINACQDAGVCEQVASQ